MGVLTNAWKDPGGEDATITVKTASSSITYAISEGTRFEIVKGSSRRTVSFIDTHVGENVKVFPRAGGSASAARVVQILLPPDPPAPKRWYGPPPPPKPTPVTGEVVFVNKALGYVRIKLPSPKLPPPPVQGVVTNVAKSLGSDTAWMTMTVAGKPRKFWLNDGTIFEKTFAGKHAKNASVLSVDKGYTVQVFPRLGHTAVAARVQVLTDGKAPLVKPKKHHDHFLSFKVGPHTKYLRVRAGKHSLTNLGGVLNTEQVQILPAAIHSHHAARVSILLPGPIKGVVQSVSATALTLKTGKKGKGGTVTIALTKSTAFQDLSSKKPMPSSAAAAKGKHVVVYKAGFKPHPAERVEIRPAKTKPHKHSGTVVSAGGGKLTVKLHGKKGGAHVFGLGPATKYVSLHGKSPKGAKVSDLKAGVQVVVTSKGGASKGAAAVAEKVEIHPKKAAKPKTKPKPKTGAKGQKASSYLGTVLSVGGGRLKVKIQGGKPAATFVVNQATRYSVKGRKHAASIKDVKVKWHVVVTVKKTPAGKGGALVAEKVEIHAKHTASKPKPKTKPTVKPKPRPKTNPKKTQKPKPKVKPKPKPRPTQKPKPKPPPKKRK
jgi:hypothetical protein